MRTKFIRFHLLQRLQNCKTEYLQEKMLMLEVHRQKNNTLSIEERLEMMIIEWMEK
jgi:hypothetical protein